MKTYYPTIPSVRPVVRYPLDYSMFDTRAMIQRQRSYIPHYEQRARMGAEQFRCRIPDCGINQTVQTTANAAVGMVGIGAISILGLGIFGGMR